MAEAVAWLHVEQSLVKHRKVLRAAAALKVDRHTLVGHLVEFWAWGLDNLPGDGDLSDLTDVELAEGAGWPARDGARFVAALSEARLIDVDDDGRRVHDWPEYGGKLLERRATERNRLRQRRADERRSLVQQTQDSEPTYAGRVEKSREDKSREDPSANADGVARKRAKSPRDRYDEFVDGLGRWGEGQYVINGLAPKNRKAVNESDHALDLLIEAYVYLLTGWWEHEWAGRDRTVWQAVECFGDYLAQREEILAAVEAARRNGTTPTAELAGVLR